MLLAQSLIAKLPELLDESVKIIDRIESSLTTKTVLTVEILHGLKDWKLDLDLRFNIYEHVIAF